MRLSFVLPSLLSLGVTFASTVPVRRDDPTVPDDGTCGSVGKYLGLYNGVAAGCPVRADCCLSLVRCRIEIMFSRLPPALLLCKILTIFGASLLAPLPPLARVYVLHTLYHDRR